MRVLDRRTRALALCATLVTVAGCGAPSAKTRATGTTRDAAPARSEPAASPYPAPVKGHYEEINTGKFDLVDGLAYSTGDGATVVYVTEKPIGSPALVAAACPMTEARALTVLRNSGYLEVRLDAKARSRYLVAGTPYGGRSREEAGRWRIEAAQRADGRIAGKMAYRGYGQFEFDLPVSKPAMKELTEGERINGVRPAEGRRTPAEAELIAAYNEQRRAAKAGDLTAVLAAQGFSAAQIASMRGLPGISADLTAHAARFLDPGLPEEVLAATGQVGARGKDPAGKAFYNFYEFSPCGEKLVLVSIGENPQ